MHNALNNNNHILYNNTVTVRKMKNETVIDMFLYITLKNMR